MNYKEPATMPEIAPKLTDRPVQCDEVFEEGEFPEEYAENFFRKVAQVWRNKDGAAMIQVLVIQAREIKKFPFTNEIIKSNFITILQSLLITEHTQAKIACLSFVCYLTYSSDGYIEYFLSENIIGLLQDAMLNDFCLADVGCSLLFNIVVNDIYNVIDALVEGNFDFLPVYQYILNEKESLCSGIKNFIAICINTPLAQPLTRLMIDSIADGARDKPLRTIALLLISFIDEESLSEFSISYCHEKDIVRTLVTRLEGAKEDETFGECDVCGISALLATLIKSIDVEVNISRIEELASFILQNNKDIFSLIIHLMNKLIDAKPEMVNEISDEFIQALLTEFENITCIAREESIVFLSVYAVNCANEKFDALATAEFISLLTDIIDVDSSGIEYVLNTFKRALESALAKGQEYYQCFLEELDIAEKIEQLLEMNESPETKDAIEISREILDFIQANEPEDGD
jgi:hypothetical protein